MKIAVMPDLHSPWHDDKALELFIKVTKLYKPDVLMVMGDFADFQAVSRYTKDPEAPSFMEEVLKARLCLDRVDAIPAKRKVFLLGNHEQRLETFIKERAVELYGMVSASEVLELEKRGYEVYPYQDVVTIGKVGFVHDLGPSGVTALRKMAQAYPSNLVFSHTHRFGLFTAGNLMGDTYECWNVGWLGDSRAIKYLPSVAVKQDWIKGFLFIDVVQGEPYFHPMRIHKGKVFYNGRIYK